MKAIKVIKKHSPAILTGLAIAGTIGAVVSAIKCKPKYDKIVEEKREEKAKNNEELTKKDILVAGIKAYWPTVLLIVASAGCAIGSTYIGARRVAETAAIASTTKKVYDEYRDAVEKKLKDKQKDEIIDDIAKSRMEKAEAKIKSAPSEQVTLYNRGRGDQLFFDCWSGRYFEADSLEDVRAAINDLNEEILNQPSVDVNTYYNYIGLPDTGDGSKLEWCTGESGFRCIDMRYVPKLIQEGPFKNRTCIALQFAPGSEPTTIVT